MAGSQVQAIPATVEPDPRNCRLCARALGTSSPGRFGLLPNCNHEYCAICLVHWSGQHQACPSCRAPFQGLIIWSTVEMTTQDKLDIYRLQNARLFNEADIVRFVVAQVPASVVDQDGGQNNQPQQQQAQQVQQQQDPHAPPVPQAPTGQMQPLAADAPAPPPDCSICMRRLGASSPGRFGLLPNCVHAFCATCLVRWSYQHQTCPACRTGFPGIIIWSEVDLTHQDKLDIYQLQNARLLNQPRATPNPGGGGGDGHGQQTQARAQVQLIPRRPRGPLRVVTNIVITPSLVRFTIRNRADGSTQTFTLPFDPQPQQQPHANNQ